MKLGGEQKRREERRGGEEKGEWVEGYRISTTYCDTALSKLSAFSFLQEPGT